MTTGIVITKGTRLAFLSPIGSPTAIRVLACPTGITGFGGSLSDIVTTCLDTDGVDSIPGEEDFGSVTVPFNFIDVSVSQQDLIAMKALGKSGITSWMIVFSTQAGLPASAVNGHLVSPGATTVEFLGYISGLSFDINTNEVVRNSLTIRRVAPREVWTLPTPTQA